ncbi:MAG: lamin tail domain-containing protein [Polaribacter sp.]|nr:lamin tail domain-containing protein [Polaribacter sp.]
MKKNYFLSFLFTLITYFGIFAQSVVITGYVDSPCSGANGRTLELYVDGTVDFTDWTIVRQTNGGGFSPGSSTIQIGALGTVTNAFVYITNSTTILQSEFGITTNVISNGNINSNGDDGFQVINNNAVVIDRFGVDGEDATGTDWDHEDTYVYRKDGSTANGGTFVSSNWIIGAKNLLDGKGLCNSSDALSTLVPFGSFKTTAPSGPTISVGNAVSGLNYFAGNGPSTEKNVAVSGINLTADITITAPTDFEVSLTSGSNFSASVSLSPSSGTVNQTDVYVRLKAGLTANSYSGDITIASTGATNKTVAVSGTVSPADPQFSFTAFLNDFNYVQSVGGPSAEQTFSVQGLFLNGDIVVTAPTNFEVSLVTGANFANSVNVSPSNGTVAQTTIYVRLKASLAVGAYSGDIVLSSTGLANKTIAIAGNVFGAALVV